MAKREDQSTQITARLEQIESTQNSDVAKPWEKALG